MKLSIMLVLMLSHLLIHAQTTKKKVTQGKVQLSLTQVQKLPQKIEAPKFRKYYTTSEVLKLLLQNEQTRQDGQKVNPDNDVIFDFPQDKGSSLKLKFLIGRLVEQNNNGPEQEKVAVENIITVEDFYQSQEDQDYVAANSPATYSDKYDSALLDVIQSYVKKKNSEMDEYLSYEAKLNEVLFKNKTRVNILEARVRNIQSQLEGETDMTSDGYAVEGVDNYEKKITAILAILSRLKEEEGDYQQEDLASLFKYLEMTNIDVPSSGEIWIPYTPTNVMNGNLADQKAPNNDKKPDDVSVISISH